MKILKIQDGEWSPLKIVPLQGHFAKGSRIAWR